MKRIKSKSRFSFVVCVFTSLTYSSVMAQVDPSSLGYYNYVPTFSGQTVYGSARMQGLAGSGVSLGGDIGQIGLNPASLGLFRKSEMSLSMGVGSNGTNANFLGNKSNSNRTWFGLPNFGVVINFSKDDIVPGIFRGGSLGISFTKTNNYQQSIQASGLNSKNSMTDYFVQMANANLAAGGTFNDVYNQSATSPNTLDALAYKSYLIDYDAASGKYYAGIGFDSSGTYKKGDPLYDFSTEKAKQQTSVITKAGQYAWDLAYGANLNDRVYLGFGGSVLISNYQTQTVFREDNIPGPMGTFELNNFTYSSSDAHRGTGFTAKIGAIVKVTDWMRLGGSFHTPTYNYMAETYSWGLNASFNNVLLNNSGDVLNNSNITTTTNTFNYRFVKPMRASMGITLLAGKRGFITGDAEYVPYQTASFQSPSSPFLFTGDNATIKNIYRNVFNYKVGAELKLTKEFSLRGGAAYYADPYNQVDNLKRDQYYFTCGGGYRIEGFYVDFAVVQGFTKDRYKPYTLNNGQEPTADLNKHYGFYQITTGFTF